MGETRLQDLDVSSTLTWTGFRRFTILNCG
ncbi:hypothetical protein L345_01686 [Ophiophagus hannah]|uniref:Uncharacterized protein n=1 Tax=Ophiophagus hannah TaxID=8665 RepID=V8PER6_OPHHA|nr:hypothetical protein L345_01686 [Ophiophagus hannah]